MYIYIYYSIYIYTLVVLKLLYINITVSSREHVDNNSFAHGFVNHRLTTDQQYVLALRRT